jgi:hypothetical protein
VGFPIALVLLIAVLFRPIAAVLRPIPRWLDLSLARLDDLLPPTRILTCGTRWWSLLALTAAVVTFAGQESLRWLWVLAVLASPLWPLSQVADRRLKALKSIPLTHSPTARCDKCENDFRRSFQCCDQRLCTDCFLDHVNERSVHEPPLADSALAFATIFNTSNLAEARLQKTLWLFSQLKRDDPGLTDAMRVSDALADIDNIKFTTCQKCGGALRHFFVEGEKVLCTDCFLDHCAEIEKGTAQPISQPSGQLKSSR